MNKVISFEPNVGHIREVISINNIRGSTIIEGLTLAVEDNHFKGAKFLKSSSIPVVIV